MIGAIVSFFILMLMIILYVSVRDFTNDLRGK